LVENLARSLKTRRPAAAAALYHRPSCRESGAGGADL